MDPREKGWTIVIVGHWNRMIFAPQWVGKEIFGASEVETFVPVIPMAATIYQKKDIVIQVSEERLIVSPRTPELSAMAEAERLVCLILGKLPYTPITALGVNFGFVETSPSEPMFELFRFPDEPGIADRGWEVGAKKAVRTLTQEGRTLNLTFTYDIPEVQIDANFHYDVKDAGEARKAVEGTTNELHEQIMALINAVYASTEEDDEDV